MKLSPNRTTENKHTATSYKMIFGSKKAKLLDMLSADGSPKEYIPVSSNGNITLIPIDETLYSLSYNGYSTTVYKHDKFFFGEIAEITGHPSWYTTNPDNIEQSFHKTADLYAPISF